MRPSSLWLACLLWSAGAAFAAAAEPPPATLHDAASSLVAELLRGPGGAKGVARRGPVRFEGVGWEGGAGVAGTSAFGLEASREVSAALAAQGVKAAEAGGKGVGATLLRGAFRVLRGGTQLSLALVDANTGRVLSEARRMLRPASLGALAGEVLPPDAQRAVELAGFVRHALGEGAAGFPLEVTTARGSHAAYFEGELLEVNVRAGRDCWVRLFHVSGSERRLTLVFPNRGDTSAFLAAGATIVVPAPGSGVTFEAAPPYGVDALVAVASTAPFEDGGWLAQQLVANADGALASRGVMRAGAYLAARDTAAAVTRGVLARGLLVRQPDAAAPPPGVTGGEPTPDPAFAAPPADAPPAGIAADALPVEATIPGVRPARNAALARATCFFTTLPRPEPRR